MARGMLATTSVTTAATHGAPTASNLAQSAPPLTGIFATLVDEHADLERLIAELAALDDGEVGRRRELFTRIAYRLAVHADAENVVFYSVLADHAETLHGVLEARREHARIEALVEALRGLPIDAEGWMNAFLRLQYAVREHVQNEQHELFPCAYAVLSEAATHDLDTKYRARRHTDHWERGLPVD